MYYKVVAVKNGRFYSRASYSDVLQDLKLVKEYSTEFWTHKKDHENSLMVFDSLKNVIEHIGSRLLKFNDFKVFECEVVNPRKYGKFVHLDTITSRSYKHYLKSSNMPPYGTVFCDSVKLFKEIPYVPEYCDL